LFEDLEHDAWPILQANISAFNIEHTEYCDTLSHQAHEMSKYIKSAVTKNKNLFVSDEQLARRWAIGLKDAAQTVKATTQKFIRNALHPI
jgi:hypothetical protein